MLTYLKIDLLKVLTHKKLNIFVNYKNQYNIMIEQNIIVDEKNNNENNQEYMEDCECVCCLTNVQKQLKCSHYIHLKCICLTGKLECPICRCELNENIFTAELLMVYDKKKIEMKKYNEEHEFELINDVINEVNEIDNMSYLMEDLLSRLIYNYD